MTPGDERMRLPNRRPCITETIEGGGISAYATVGFCPETHEPCEIFLRPKSGRTGSHVDFLCDDIAVVISVALQHGLSADALRRSIARVPALTGSAPATLVGAALDLLVREGGGA